MLREFLTRLRFFLSRKPGRCVEGLDEPTRLSRKPYETGALLPMQQIHPLPGSVMT
jgi:hypothetical protein